MANLQLELAEGMYREEILGHPFEFPAQKENTYSLIHFLRGFKKPSGKQGGFSQEQIARAIPDFEGNTRQGVDDRERRFRKNGRNLLGYLTRKRKVDAEVVEATRTELLHNPL